MGFRPQDLPRVFQADIGRLYSRVIHPALLELPIGETGGHGLAASLDDFLENVETQTTALLADEARRGFALMLAALFERQMALWISECGISVATTRRATPSFAEQLTATAAHGAVDLVSQQLGERLTELHTLANVVRHGDGRSLGSSCMT